MNTPEPQTNERTSVDLLDLVQSPINKGKSSRIVVWAALFIVCIVGIACMSTMFGDLLRFGHSQTSITCIDGVQYTERFPEGYETRAEFEAAEPAAASQWKTSVDTCMDQVVTPVN